MTSISSMITFVVLLLATYSYSAPILTEIESTTMDIQLENSTMEISVENATTMVHDKRSGNTIEKGDSASSEEATTVYTSTIDDLTTIEGQTDKPVKRENEEEAKRETEEEDKRETEEENKRENEEENKRETEEENKRETEEENKRETEEENKRQNEEENKRETEEENKRQNEDNQEVTPENEDNQQVKHENEGNQEGTPENEDNQQIKRENEDEKYTFDVTTGESSPLDVTTVESTSEAHMERRMKDFSMNSFESNSDFNKRAMGPIQSVESDEMTTVVNGEMEHKSNTIQPSSSTDEFAKTTGLVGEKQTSTSEYETTVEPVEESTNTSMVETKNSTKIIAIIPGRIAETKIVINPIKEVPVVAQKPLSQGQN